MSVSVQKRLKDLDFLPPFCVSPPETVSCNFLGLQLDCVKNFTDDDFRMTGLYAGHIWTFMLTFFVGAVNLSYIRPFLGWQWKDSMKVTMGLYAIITAFFALFRITTGISTPLIVTAALHNLCEWSIALHCADKDFWKFGNGDKSYFGRNFLYASCFILIIITITNMIPDIITSLLTEQLFGAMLDIALPVMFGKMMFFNDNAEVRKFYILPFLAHGIHLAFTIIPLSFTINWRSTPSLFTTFFSELFINFSVPLTHILYCVWSYKADDNINEAKQNPEKNEEKEKEGDTGEPSKPEERFLREEFQVKGVGNILISSGIFAFILILIVPLYMGLCKEERFCVRSETVHQTTTFVVSPDLGNSLEDLLASKDIANTAKSYEGNVDFIISKSVADKNKHVIEVLDVWQSYEYAKKWMKSEHALFLESVDVVDYLQDGKIVSTGYLSAFVDSVNCRPLEEIAHSFQYHNSCKSLWMKLSSTSRCDLLPGCVQIARNDENSDFFSFSNGKILKGKRHLGAAGSRNLTYDFGSSDDELFGGFKSYIFLEPVNSTLCAVRMKMSIPRKGEVHSKLLKKMRDEIRFIQG